MSDRAFERAVTDWLDDGSDRTPRSAIDAVLLAVKTTPQERDLRIPWRFPPMLARFSPTSVAAVVLVAAVGAGSLVYLNSTGPGSAGGQPTAAPTPIPTAATPAPSQVAPGIGAWTTYTSAVNGITLGYPNNWHVESLATRAWRAGDDLSPGSSWAFADVFASPDGDDQIGLWVWQMRPEPGADIASAEGLAAWASANACEKTIDACATLPDMAVPMSCHVDVVACGWGVLVPLSHSTTAFLGENGGLPNGVVTIVMLGRADDFPGAAQYGGTVRLLESILTTLDFWPAEPARPAGS